MAPKFIQQANVLRKLGWVPCGLTSQGVLLSPTITGPRWSMTGGRVMSLRWRTYEP